MNENYYLFVYHDSTGKDPLFEVKQCQTVHHAIAFMHTQYAEKKWAGPKIEMFRFNLTHYHWFFFGEVTFSMERTR